MIGKIDFLIMFDGLPEMARNKLSYNYLGKHINLQDYIIEIKNSTLIGKQILKDLGYENR